MNNGVWLALGRHKIEREYYEKDVPHTPTSSGGSAQ